MSNKDPEVDSNINSAPNELQPALRRVRALIRFMAPDAVERTDYFDLPGYSYDGIDYNGMLVWFSYKKSNVRLHVRPPVLEKKRDFRFEAD